MGLGNFPHFGVCCAAAALSPKPYFCEPSTSVAQEGLEVSHWFRVQVLPLMRGGEAPAKKWILELFPCLKLSFELEALLKAHTPECFSRTSPIKPVLGRPLATASNLMTARRLIQGKWFRGASGVSPELIRVYCRISDTQLPVCVIA